MIQLRPASERGHADHGWLETRLSFSFANYFDPAHMGFRNLRVLNEDRIQPGKGFGVHPHKDMEIVTYIIQGSLRHRDSAGNESVIQEGEVQRMTAGTGIQHSEFNASSTDIVHLLQIWIYPNREGLKPGYETRKLNRGDQTGQWILVASPNGGGDALTIHQNVDLLAVRLEAGEKISRPLKANRYAWAQLVYGSLSLNGTDMAAGDGAAISGEESLNLAAREDSELLLFDLA